MSDATRLKHVRHGSGVTDDVEDEAPQISLAEMLDDLCIDDPDSETTTSEM